MPSTEDTNTVINMRVTANSIQGHRKYMEDCYKIRFQRESSLMNSQNQALLSAANAAGYFNKNKIGEESDSQSDILFSYFGIFDGHGGKEASQFAKEKLYWKIVEQEDFWSEDHSKVLNAIREGFIQCHMEMWDELDKWPKTASGLPSTSGSTATVLFIRKSKAYVGHVGDSGLLIGFSKNNESGTKSHLPWQARKLTRDHKPEDPVELKRIESMGGSIATKSGVNRVVWNRPILNPNKHRSNQSNNPPSTNQVPYDLDHYKSRPAQIQTERIPFLAVARSLGDLWSYDINRDEFIVSPVPDVFHFDLDPTVHKCLILATDGLWNVMRANECVDLVRQTDKETEKISSDTNRMDLADTTAVQPFVNPSQRLVNTAMQRCCEKMIRADNTSCITIMLDQPPSYEDYLTNSNETIIKGTNLTNLDINKTFDQTGRILNISDDFDEDESEIFDGTDGEISRIRHARKRKSTTRSTFNQTTSTEIPDNEFTTPVEKRSRSLISVRRRRWSASSNRSTSVSSTHHSQQRESKSQRNNNELRSSSKMNKFVNMDNRERRIAVANEANNKINRQYMNKSSSSNAVYQTRGQQQRQNLFVNQSNMYLNADPSRFSDDYNAACNYAADPMCRFDQTAKSARDTRASVNGKSHKNRTSALTLRLREHPTNLNSRKSMLNASNVSVGINKLAKNMRKSCNDIYTMTKSLKRQVSSSTTVPSATTTNMHREINKENERKSSNSDEIIGTNNNKSKSYSKRLQRLKNRLIQTKKNLFSSKKRKNINDGDISPSDQSDESNFSKDQSRHTSMPNLSKIELDDNKIEFIDNDLVFEETNNDLNNEPSLKRQQSFVNNFKSKFKRKSNANVQKKNSPVSNIPSNNDREAMAFSTSTRKQTNKRTKLS